MDKSATTNGSNAASRVKSIINQSPLFCKVIELILCIVTIGLIVDPFKSVEMQPNPDQAGNVYVSICGYIMINSIIILCHFIGEHQPKRMGYFSLWKHSNSNTTYSRSTLSMMFSLVGGILCFASGAVLVYNWSKLNSTLTYRYHKQYSNQMVTSGVFAFLASLVFAIDVILTNEYN